MITSKLPELSKLYCVIGKYKTLLNNPEAQSFPSQSLKIVTSKPILANSLAKRIVADSEPPKPFLFKVSPSY